MERTNQFVGQSLAFLDAVERASRAAPLNRPVLVIGERGTGKELIAERLHHLSSRWAGPLVTMNCAALPENLIEAELFGHEAGSFTGAAKTRHGRFEEADGGTLFLDELATLSSPAQDRLLRAVEYGEITRIGASKPIRVDVRIVAATNEHLPRAGRSGPVSRRPARPPVVRGRHLAAAARAERRHSAARRAFRAAHGVGARMAELAGLFDPRSGRARNLPLAGQCPRIAQRRRARGLSRGGPGAADRRDPVRPVSFAVGARRQRLGGTRCPKGQRSPRRAAGRTAIEQTGDLRGAVNAYERALLEDALARSRFNQRATAAALGLSYDQLRHALKRHKLLDAAAG